MSEAGMTFLLSQLGYQSPGLVVCAVGVVLGLMWLRRSPLPAILALIGCGLMVVTSLGVAVVQALLFDRRANDIEFTRAMTAVAVLGSAGRAVGLGLLVAAAFVGRQRVLAPDD